MQLSSNYFGELFSVWVGRQLSAVSFDVLYQLPSSVTTLFSF